MASDAIEAVSKMAPSQEDLSDEQIEEMLAQATTRLREKEEAKMFQTEAPQKFTFPKMNAGALEKPYVVVKGHVAEADKSRLIDDKHRQTSSLIRKVEDPVTAKKLAAEVRFTPSLLHQPHHVYEEDIPIFSLEQSRGTVLVSFCQTESSFIHSYSETLQPHCLTRYATRLRTLTNFVIRKRKRLLVPNGSTCPRPTSPQSSREISSF